MVRGSRLAIGCAVDVAADLREKMAVSWRRGDGTLITGGVGGEGNVLILPDNSLGRSSPMLWIQIH